MLRGRLLVARVLQSGDAGRQVGVVVSKKSFHDAVDRNRAKRILRAGFRAVRADLPSNADWVLVGRSSLRGRRAQDVAAELLYLSSRAGMGGAAPLPGSAP